MSLRNFDMNLLVFFEALWHERNVSRSAGVLNVTQPTVSAALKRLRHHFKDQLFVWNGQQMVPTSKAEALAPHILDLISRAESIHGDTQFNPLHISRNFVIASTDYVLAQVAPALLRVMEEKAPNLRIDFVDLKPAMVRSAGTQAIDLLVVPQDALPMSGYRSQVLWVDSYLMAYSKQSSPPKTAAEFYAKPQIKFSAEARRIVDHETLELQALGVSMRIRLTLDQHLLIPELVANTECIAITPKRVVQMLRPNPDVAFSEPPVALPELIVGMYWLSDQENDRVHYLVRTTMAEAVSP